MKQQDAPPKSGRLLEYLSKIGQGEPINYEAFLNVLPEPVKRQHNRYFDCTKVAKQRWQVHVLDNETFQGLIDQATPVGSRREGALQGDSHRQRTRSALVLVYHAALNDQRPDVVAISGEATVQSFTRKTTALVVENEDNFTAWPDMMELAATALEQELSLANCDVVLGGGNRVLKDQVVGWLDQYDRVLCAFDYDLGGLRTYQGLTRSLSTPPHWIEPPDWEPWLKYFRKSPGDTKRLLSAIELAGELGLPQLMDAFKRTRRFMEQESLLDEH